MFRYMTYKKNVPKMFKRKLALSTSVIQKGQANQKAV